MHKSTHDVPRMGGSVVLSSYYVVRILDDTVSILQYGMPDESSRVVVWLGRTRTRNCEIPEETLGKSIFAEMEL